MDFEALTPEVVMMAVEQAFDLSLDGTITPYPSYINRVYGLRSDEGRELVAKFYRPGRWSAEAVAAEHEFVLDCAEADVAVVAPSGDADGDTLHEVEIDDTSYLFAVFPKMGGRNFDAERDEDWHRLGTLVARCHIAGRKRKPTARAICHPEKLLRTYVRQILEEGAIPPDLREEFNDICSEVIEETAAGFDRVHFQRVHGDLHRGNILDRPDTGLLVIDFDDMMSGPAVQDLWLLLPGYANDCRRELTMLLDGYEDFLPFDRHETGLIEPLRFMRMLYFLAWQVWQREDRAFREHFPHWGTAAFWEKELEDLRTQRTVVRDGAG